MGDGLPRTQYWDLQLLPSSLASQPHALWFLEASDGWTSNLVGWRRTTGPDWGHLSSGLDFSQWPGLLPPSWLPSHLMSTLLQLQSRDATLPLSPLGTKEEEREHQRCPWSSGGSIPVPTDGCGIHVVDLEWCQGYWCSGNWDKDFRLWGKPPKTKAGAREMSHAHLWSACIGSGEHL